MTLRIRLSLIALCALGACAAPDGRPGPMRPSGTQAPAEAPLPEARPADRAMPATGAPAVLAPPGPALAGADSSLPPPPPPAADDGLGAGSDGVGVDAAAAAPSAAGAAPAGAGARLGTTVASLGPPSEPGVWLRTPLVTAVMRGRIEHPATGQSIGVELRPSGGEPGSGSQISIAAMRLLGLPLTSLPELVVYGG